MVCTDFTYTILCVRFSSLLEVKIFLDFLDTFRYFIKYFTYLQSIAHISKIKNKCFTYPCHQSHFLQQNHP